MAERSGTLTPRQMTKRELERLSDLLLKFYEATEDGGLRDEISHVRHEVNEQLDYIPSR
jgi:hypothetical protein